MMTFLAFSKNKGELMQIKKQSVDISSLISDEDLRIYDFNDESAFSIFIKNCPIIDISCLDITGKDGIKNAVQIRSTNADMFIVLIADANISPTSYIIPSIMASSLILRPFKPETAKEVLKTAFREYYNRYIEEDGSKSFVIENIDEVRQLVPYSCIIYFESREKKIFLATENVEYPFYGTLDKLEKMLSDDFVRCHRSYIVAKKRIKKVISSRNAVILDNDYEIPLSRSYKSKLKELI